METADLEARIQTETEAAFAAIKVALQHAANAGVAVGEAQDRLTQNPFQRWVGGDGCPVDRHVAMVVRRIGKCEDLDAKSQTLADLMLTRAAEYIAAAAGVPSKAQRMAASR